MAFLTYLSFGTPPYDIPDPNKARDAFNLFCGNAQDALLKKVLGYQMWKEFNAGIAALPDVWDPAVATTINQEYLYGNDIWKALTAQTGTVPVAGADWELVEEDNVWVDLRDGVEYQYCGKTWKWEGMVALLIPYTHKEWILSRAELFSNVGTIKPKPENSVSQSDVRKIAKSDIAFRKLLGDECNKKGTMYGYLSVNTVRYPSWDFTCPPKINALGI